MTYLIAEVARHQPVSAKAARVWDLISAEDAILKWHPSVAQCVSGMDQAGRITRAMTLHATGGGAPVRMDETELLRSAEIMTITYMVEIHGLPIRNYLAQMSITPHGQASCQATLRSRFTMPEAAHSGADDLVGGFYEAGLTRLAALMGAADPA
ncbi:MAG: SRPBCC family protein [Pseudomonadota bacterium]